MSQPESTEFFLNLARYCGAPVRPVCVLHYGTPRVKATDELPDSSFDYIFSDHAPVEDFRDLFREMRRLLKPGAFSVHRFPSHWDAPQPPRRTLVALAGKAGVHLQFIDRENVETQGPIARLCERMERHGLGLAIPLVKPLLPTIMVLRK